MNVYFKYFVISTEDHWKKEFLGDNTAMMLTDVSREVVIIRDFLQDFVKPILEPLQVKKDDTTDDVTKLDPECSRKTRPPTQQDMGNRVRQAFYIFSLREAHFLNKSSYLD